MFDKIEKTSDDSGFSYSCRRLDCLESDREKGDDQSKERRQSEYPDAHIDMLPVFQIFPFPSVQDILVDSKSLGMLRTDFPPSNTSRTALR